MKDKKEKIVCKIPLKKLYGKLLHFHQGGGSFNEGNIKGAFSNTIPDGSIWVRMESGNEYRLDVRDVLEAVIKLEQKEQKIRAAALKCIQ